MPDWRTEIRARLATLRLRPEREVEIVEEVAQHLDDRHREMQARGMAADDAEAAAWRELEQDDVLAREVARVERPLPLELPPPGAPARGRWFAALWQDLRYAVRALRKQPAFAVTVIAALALSIGPVTATASLGNWLFWRPLPGVMDADRVALVWFGRWRGESSVSPSGVSYLNLADLKASLKTSTGFAGVQESGASLAIGEGLPRLVELAQVTGDFFEVVGARPIVGRAFDASEDQAPMGAPVAVVSTRLAAAEFGSAQRALGQRLLLNRQSFTVIGVAPPAFLGITSTSFVDVWITGASASYLSGRPAVESRTDGGFYMFVARLAPGRSFSQLEAELGTVTRRFAEVHPKENAKFQEVTARVFPRLGLQATVRQGMRSMLNVLLAITGVLLVLGCANVGNMLIARGIRREPEVAIRQALGASGRRLVQWQLAESCLLSLGGAVFGVALAIVLKQIIQQLLIPAPPGFDIGMPIDLRVLGVTLAAALTTGLVAGLAPAWLMARSRRSLLGAAGRSGAGRTSSRAPRLRSTLAIVQLALSLTLVIGALLLVATLRNLRGVDLGFDPTNLVALQVSLGDHGYTADRAVAFQSELQRALTATPAIQSVTVGYRPPFGSSTSVQLLAAGVDTPDPTLRAYSNGVSDSYFSTVGTAIVRGRPFTADEAFARAPIETMPVIVSESLARRLFGDTDAIGRAVRLAATLSHPVRELPIVGVARDAHRSRVTIAPEPFLYLPIGRYDLGRISTAIIVRSTEPLPAVTAAVRAVAARLDRAVPVLQARPLIGDIDRSLRQQRLFATMLGWVSVLAFVLAGVGLHGLVSQAATERSREFGIRLALGARRADIARLVARWVVMMAGVGTVVGLVLAGVGSRLVKSMLFGVTALEPAVYALAVVMMAGVVGLAAAWPAYRATRVQPVDVLRAE